MPPLLSPRRVGSTLSLSRTLAQVESAAAAPEPEELVLPWWVAAVAGALATAISGWVIAAGLSVLGWLAAAPGTFTQALQVGTQLWLLTNGRGAQLGALDVTVVPWGATGVLAFMFGKFAAFAARQTRGPAVRSVVGVTAVMIVTYLVPLLTAAVVWGEPSRSTLAEAAVVLLLLVAAAWGSCSVLDVDPTSRWPQWLRAVLWAVAGGQLVMVTVGAAALTASLVIHLARVEKLTRALDPGVLGGVTLVFAQLAVLPNAVIWAASYTIGSGFSLGDGSVVAPAWTELGLLPGIPLLAGLPATGAGAPVLLWWLVGGVAAGVVAASVVVLRCPAARLDETCVVGALVGMLTAVVFTALAWVSGGDLGSDRLTGLGPRMGSLLVLSATTMGLAGMATGLLLGLVRHRRSRRSRL